MIVNAKESAKFGPGAAVCLGRVVEVAEPGQQAEAAFEVGADQPRGERHLPGRGLGCHSVLS